MVSGCRALSWEWVAPVVVRADARAEREKVTQERRDAYLAALRVARLELARKKYRRTGEAEKLADVEEKWPKGERVRMWIDARILIEAFGSVDARDYSERCSAASGAGDEKQMMEVYEDMLKLVRAELGISSFGASRLRETLLDQ
jgi:hypothetical protein